MRVLNSIFFFLVLLFLTRQVPLSSYSFIMNIAVVLFMGFNIKYILICIKKDVAIYMIVNITFIMLLVLVLYSMLLGNEISLIIRFFSILTFILLAYFVKPHESFVSIFILLITLQALFVIGLEFYLISNFDAMSYLPIRHVFLNNNWGDVYTYGGDFWKIQIKGNALLPFAFFISIIYYKGNKRIVFGSIFSAAILCAGNFAFILGVIFFLGLVYIYQQKLTLQKIVVKLIVGFILLGAVSMPAYTYLADVIEEKSVHSNAIRIDQANVLINNMSESVGAILFGKGLGNKINVRSQWRDYSNYIYYELQAIYILNQVGILFFVFFIAVNILFAWYSMKDGILLIAYGSYVFYALFNPYLLDTNHIAVIVILLSLRKVLDEKNILNTRSV